MLLGQLRHGCWRPVEDHTLMAAFEQPTHHICAHPAKSDHAELHRSLLVQNRLLMLLRFVHYLCVGGGKPLRGRGTACHGDLQSPAPSSHLLHVPIAADQSIR